ncbi:MAG: hypothetical protein AAFX58_09820, partial [Pseudomonadota bacterium]
AGCAGITVYWMHRPAEWFTRRHSDFGIIGATVRLPQHQQKDMVLTDRPIAGRATRAGRTE